MLRNIASLSLASIAVKPLWFVFLTVLCARWLSAADFGVLTTALSFASIVISFTNLGVGMYMVSEISGSAERAAKLASRFIPVRLIVGMFFLAFALTVVTLVGYDDLLRTSIAIAIIYFLFFSMIEVCHHAFQGAERIHLQSISIVVEKVLVVLVGSVVLFTTRSPLWTLLGMSAAMLLALFITVLLTDRGLARLRFRFIHPTRLLAVLRPLAPYAAIAVLGMLFFRIDTIMVEAIGGLVQAGQYGFAFRIVEALNMLPLIVVMSVVYPRLSTLAAGHLTGELRWLVRRTATILFPISIILAAGVFVIGPFLVNWIITDPDLVLSSDILSVLVWVLPLTCIRSLLLAALLATRLTSAVVLAVTLAVLFNILANLWAIPVWGPIGAAYTAIASEVLLISIYFMVWRSGLAVDMDT